MYNFKNTILIVVFNYSNCICNKDYLIELYGKHFKKIVFYSDYPVLPNTSDVHYVNIEKGTYTHRIFSDFYKNYKQLLDESDGLFYTMDDNILM